MIQLDFKRELFLSSVSQWTFPGRPADPLRSRTFGVFLLRVERTKIFPPARIKVQPCLAYTNCYTLLRNGAFTYVKKCFAGFLKSANALLQVPHRNFSLGSQGDSSSRGPKQANRSPETARNFLRSAFRLLGFFPQTEHLKTFNRHNYCHQHKILQQWRHFVFRDHVFTAQRPRACACIIPSCCQKIPSFSVNPIGAAEFFANDPLVF